MWGGDSRDDRSIKEALCSYTYLLLAMTLFLLDWKLCIFLIFVRDPGYQRLVFPLSRRNRLATSSPVLLEKSALGTRLVASESADATSDKATTHSREHRNQKPRKKKPLAPKGSDSWNIAKILLANV